MSKKLKIALVVGSLRKDAYSDKIANLLMNVASEKFEFHKLKIADLPFYNEDLDNGNPPTAWQNLRTELASISGVIFITPEYNRSMPAVLKNALDVGSRPYGQNAWSGKPALAVSLSQGPMGGYGANQHLRQVLSVLNMPVMPQPEVYIGKVQDLVADSDTDANQKFLNAIMSGYEDWFNKNHV